MGRCQEKKATPKQKALWSAALAHHCGWAACWGQEEAVLSGGERWLQACDTLRESKCGSVMGKTEFSFRYSLAG